MKNLKILTLLIALVVLGVLTRTYFHIKPNLEFVTAVSIVSGYIFTKTRWTLIVPVITLFLSDLIIGNTIIFIFTWSGFLMSFSVGILFSSQKFSKFKDSVVKFTLSSQLAAILSTMLFYLWTNLGVVLTTNMYQKNISGLIESYVNALPFLKIQMAGNIVIVPLIFGLTFLILNSNKFQSTAYSIKRIAHYES